MGGGGFNYICGKFRGEGGGGVTVFLKIRAGGGVLSELPWWGCGYFLEPHYRILCSHL